MIMFFKTSLRFFFLVFAYGFEYTFLNFDDFFCISKIDTQCYNQKVFIMNSILKPLLKANKKEPLYEYSNNI